MRQENNSNEIDAGGPEMQESSNPKDLGENNDNVEPTHSPPRARNASRSPRRINETNELSPSPRRNEMSPSPRRNEMSPSPRRNEMSLSPRRNEMSPSPRRNEMSPSQRSNEKLSQRESPDGGQTSIEAEIETFIKDMESDEDYRLDKKRLWFLYEKVRSNQKSYENLNLYTYAINQSKNVFLEVGQVVRIKSRKKEDRFFIISLGNSETTGRERLSAVVAKENDTECFLSVTLGDLIPIPLYWDEVTNKKIEEKLELYISVRDSKDESKKTTCRKRKQTSFFSTSSAKKPRNSTPSNATSKPTTKTKPSSSAQTRSRSVQNNKTPDTIIIPESSNNSMLSELDPTVDNEASVLNLNKNKSDSSVPKLAKSENNAKTVSKANEKSSTLAPKSVVVANSEEPVSSIPNNSLPNAFVSLPYNSFLPSISHQEHTGNPQVLLLSMQQNQHLMQFQIQQQHQQRIQQEQQKLFQEQQFQHQQQLQLQQLQQQQQLAFQQGQHRNSQQQFEQQQQFNFQLMQQQLQQQQYIYSQLFQSKKL